MQNEMATQIRVAAQIVGVDISTLGGLPSHKVAERNVAAQNSGGCPCWFMSAQRNMYKRFSSFLDSSYGVLPLYVLPTRLE
jgi:hypothetical protein